MSRSEHLVSREASPALEALMKLAVMPVIVVFYGISAWQFSFTPDETYIYLRTASNLALGNGFAFNPGQSGNDVPGPLWVLIVAAAKAGGLDPYIAAKLLDLVFAAILLLVLGRLTAIIAGNNFFPLFAVAMAAFDPFNLSRAAAGTGGSLEALLLILTLLYIYKTEYVLASLVSAAFTLLRPDGIFLFLLVQSDNVLNTTSLRSVRTMAVVSFLVYGAIVLPWFIVRTLLFESAVPYTGLLAVPVPDGGLFLWMTQAMSVLSFGTGFVLAFRLGRARTVLVEVYPFLFLLGVLATGMIFSSGSAPGSARLILPLVAVFGTWGMKKMIDFWKLKWQAVVATVIIVVLPTIFANSMIYQSFFVPSMTGWQQETERALRPIAYWLRGTTDHGDVIAASFPGYLGYVSERAVVRQNDHPAPSFVVDRSKDSTRLSSEEFRKLLVKTAFGNDGPVHYTVYRRIRE